MTDVPCATCQYLTDNRLGYSRYRITRILPGRSEKDTGFFVGFQLQGYGAREFYSVWREPKEMYVCDPKKEPKDGKCGYPENKPDFVLVREATALHSRLGQLPVPEEEGAGDIMLGKEFCTRYRLPFRDKWPGQLGLLAEGEELAQFDKVRVRVHGWVLALEFPELSGLTFHLNPYRSDVIEDVSGIGVPDKPFAPEVKEMELPINRARLQTLLRLQPDSSSGGFKPWTKQAPADVLHQYARDALFQGDVSKLLRDVDALRALVEDENTPDAELARAMRKLLGYLPR